MFFLFVTMLYLLIYIFGRMFYISNLQTHLKRIDNTQTLFVVWTPKALVIDGLLFKTNNRFFFIPLHTFHCHPCTKYEVYCVKLFKFEYSCQKIDYIISYFFQEAFVTHSLYTKNSSCQCFILLLTLLTYAFLWLLLFFLQYIPPLLFYI